MRVRIMLFVAVLVTLVLSATGSAFARCYTPCVAGQNCIESCWNIPDIELR
jgi:hypothetical protein